MRRSHALVALLAVAVVGACSPDKPTTTATSTATATATQTMRDPSLIEVSARANIFGAGREQPPAPGGGGAGVPPVLWKLTAGANRVVTFSDASGEVNPIQEQPNSNGPGGDGKGPTNIESHQGISGIVHGKNGMFLVGVFLTDAAPADPAPARLDFTGKETFDALSPKIGQTFFIGDGVGRRYNVPPNATRLYVGFADAAAFFGAPGFYGNNLGRVYVKVNVATG